MSGSFLQRWAFCLEKDKEYLVCVDIYYTTRGIS